MLEEMLSKCEDLLERVACGDENVDMVAASIAESSSRDAFDDMQESSTSSVHRARSPGSNLSAEPAALSSASSAHSSRRAPHADRQRRLEAR